MRLWLSLALVVLTSCTSVQPQESKGPNGKATYSMNCSGIGRSLDDCYKKATELCPKGYNVVDRTTGTVATPIQNGTLASTQYALVVECK